MKLTSIIKDQDSENKDIQYVEWKQVPNPLSPKGSKVSRKVPCLAKLPILIKNLIVELKFMKEHTCKKPSHAFN